MDPLKITPPERQSLIDSLKGAVWTDLDPLTDEIERTNRIPEELWSRMRQLGYFGLTIPTQYGGIGASFGEFLPVMEEVSKTSAATRLLLHGFNSIWRMFYDFGSEEQKARYIPPMARGEDFYCLALTDSAAGTGADIDSRAFRNGSTFVVEAQKHFITFADFGHFIVFANADGGPGSRGLSAFLLKRDTPGISIAPMPEMLGNRGVVYGLLTFQGCVVSEGDILGGLGQGMGVINSYVVPARLFWTASLMGISQRLLELAVEYARKRVTFGKPIAERQAVQILLAEMATDVYASRCMLAKVAAMFDQGEHPELESSLMRLFAVEMSSRVSDKALTVHGGTALTRPHALGRLYRDLRLLWFEGGTTIVQKLLAGKGLLSR